MGLLQGAGVVAKIRKLLTSGIGRYILPFQQPAPEECALKSLRILLPPLNHLENPIRIITIPRGAMGVGPPAAPPYGMPDLSTTFTSQEQPMDPSPSTVEPTVTLTEALSGIVWARLSSDTKRVFAEIGEDAERAGLGQALRTLYRRLDTCILEDALNAQILFLEEDYLPELDPNAKNAASRLQRTHNAIRELAQIVRKLKKYEDKFIEECESENSRIRSIAPPMRIGRYLPNSVQYIAYSVAVWVREELDITIPQWDDLSNYDLFDQKLEKEPWIPDARIESRLLILNALIEGVLNANIPETSARIPKKRGYVEKEGFRPTSIKNRDISKPVTLNVSGYKDFIEWQFLRISGNEDRKLLSKDPPRTILKTWAPGSPLSSTKLNLYETALDGCVDSMIAGLVVGLAEDSFAVALRKAKPLNWRLPMSLPALSWDAIDGVSSATVKRIVETAIDKMLKEANRV